MVLTVDQVVRHKGVIFGGTANERCVYEFNSKVTGECIGCATPIKTDDFYNYKAVCCGSIYYVRTLADARRKFVAYYNTRVAALEQVPALEQMPEKEQACPKVELVSYDDEPYKIRYEAVLNGHRKYLGSYFTATKVFASCVLDIAREDTSARESQETLERIISLANRVSEGIL